MNNRMAEVVKAVESGVNLVPFGTKEELELGGINLAEAVLTDVIGEAAA